MAISESPHRIESIEEAGEVLRHALDRAREILAHSRGSITTATNWGNVEKIPDSGRRGVVLRGMTELNGIEIPGIKPNEILSAILTQILGEPRVIPDDAAEQNLYIVECDFAVGNRVPTLRVQQTERHDDAVRALAEMYRDVLEGSKRSRKITWNKESILRFLDELIAEGHMHSEIMRELRAELQRPRGTLNAPPLEYDFSFLRILGALTSFSLHSCSGPETHQRNRFSAKAQSLATKELLELEKLLERPQDEKPRHLVWVAGVTDMTHQDQIFGLVEPLEGAKFHMMQIPPLRSDEKSKPQNLLGSTAQSLQAIVSAEQI